MVWECVCVCVYVCVCVCVNVHAWVCAWVGVWTRVCGHACVCVCARTHVCTCVCVRVCMPVCVDRMNLKYALRWHIHISVHSIQCQCQKYARILKLFKDSEPTGLKVDVAACTTHEDWRPSAAARTAMLRWGPHQCIATWVLCLINRCFNSCVEQSHKDTVQEATAGETIRPAPLPCSGSLRGSETDAETRKHVHWSYIYMCVHRWQR